MRRIISFDSSTTSFPRLTPYPIHVYPEKYISLSQYVVVCSLPHHDISALLALTRSLPFAANRLARWSSGALHRTLRWVHMQIVNKLLFPLTVASPHHVHLFLRNALLWLYLP